MIASSATAPGRPRSLARPRASDGEPGRLVRGAGRRDRRVRRADDRGRARTDDDGQGPLEQVAEVRGGGRAPLRRAAGRFLRGAARPDRGDRLVPPVLAGPGARSPHGSIPAALDRPRDRRCRASRRARADEPLSPPPPVSVLAARALPELRRLDGRVAARARQRHGPHGAVDAADLRGVGGDGVRARSPAHRSPRRRRPGRRSSRRDRRRARVSGAGRQAPPSGRRGRAFARA